MTEQFSISFVDALNTALFVKESDSDLYEQLTESVHETCSDKGRGQILSTIKESLKQQPNRTEIFPCELDQFSVECAWLLSCALKERLAISLSNTLLSDFLIFNKYAYSDWCFNFKLDPRFPENTKVLPFPMRLSEQEERILEGLNETGLYVSADIAGDGYALNLFSKKHGTRKDIAVFDFKSDKADFDDLMLNYADAIQEAEIFNESGESVVSLKNECRVKNGKILLSNVAVMEMTSAFFRGDYFFLKLDNSENLSFKIPMPGSGTVSKLHRRIRNRSGMLLENFYLDVKINQKTAHTLLNRFPWFHIKCSGSQLIQMTDWN